MKIKLGFPGVTLMVAAALIAGPLGVSRASADNVFTVELYKPILNGSGCTSATGSLRVDLVENGVTTIHYASGGVTTFTVSTPTNNEVLTIKYYRSTGALAGSYDVTLLDPCGNAAANCSDPWDFGKGFNGDACDTWAHGRLVHIKYTP